MEICGRAKDRPQKMHVILSEQSESKDLRTDLTMAVPENA